MKKIMFNGRFGLTQAVLDGRKTMTRRIIGNVEKIDSHFDIDDRLIGDVFEVSQYAGTVKSTYHIGEEVAVAQSYSNLREVLAKRDFKRTDALYDRFYRALQMGEAHDGMPGWDNKMFVRADLMPHRIRITDIRVERLQDISEEDAMREGIKKMEEGMPYRFDENGKIHLSADPRMLFADLIDRISGRGTWKRNPWVFAYEFEMIK